MRRARERGRLIVLYFRDPAETGRKREILPRRSRCTWIDLGAAKGCHHGEPSRTLGHSGHGMFLFGSSQVRPELGSLAVPGPARTLSTGDCPLPACIANPK